MKNASLAQCAPRATDYTYMWWAYGFRAMLDNEKGKTVMCFQTGEYGLAMDMARVRLLNIGRIAKPLSHLQAATQDNSVIFDLPKGDLTLSITVNGKEYRVADKIGRMEHREDFPARIVESGRLFQRADIMSLEFVDKDGAKLNAGGRLEIGIWPDRLSMIFEITPNEKVFTGSMEIVLKENGQTHRQWLSFNGGVAPGAVKRVAVACKPGRGAAEKVPCVEVEVTDPQTKQPVEVEYDPARGWFYVNLPRKTWRMRDDLDRLDRLDLQLCNPTKQERLARLNFAMDYGFEGVTGMSPMIRDSEGNPCGIPVQISKNWHGMANRIMLLQGPWFHGFCLVRIPAETQLDLEFAMAYGRWGGVPAASHAQLSLCGYGVNQLWDQVAIGSWGESICYDPDVNLGRSCIDDVRPLMIMTPGKEETRYNWTGNVGGGDFLAYFNEKNQKQFLTRMRTAYRAYCPNLTEVVYAGVSADGKIAARVAVSTPRSEDFQRSFHTLRYDVLKPTPFQRLAFYQMGSDGYNCSKPHKIAIGNKEGLVEEWEPKLGGLTYERQGVVVKGETPWVSLHEIEDLGIHYARASRGLVIRSWKARLGGKDCPDPILSFFRIHDSDIASVNVELSAPAGVKKLLPGDFLEATVEYIIMPSNAEDYYGPNKALREVVAEGGNTWKPILREAVGNDLKVKASKEKVLGSYPICVKAAADKAEVEVTGGIGYVPVTFTGLSDYKGFKLSMGEKGKALKAVDQSVHGKDFWQTDYDPATKTYSITYNVLLDAPGGKARTMKLAFGKGSR